MKTIFSIIGGLSLVAVVAMYFIGKNSTHLSELADFFWVPLPLAVISFAVALKK